MASRGWGPGGHRTSIARRWSAVANLVARTLHRESEPTQYWSGIVIYALLVIALLFIF